MTQIACIHDYQLPKIPQEQYIMFLQDGINWGWTKAELAQFRRLWREGESIWTIARELERDVDECALLCIDQMRQRKIRRRAGGIWGKWA